MKSILVAFIGFIVLPSVLAERSPRIIGGHNAEPHEFPFTVLIKGNGSFCAGTIISDLFILTAGHCLYGKKLTDLVIKAGKHNISAIEGTEQTRNAAKIFMHEHLDLRAVQNDIALIKLDNPLIFKNSVKKIDNLPIKNSVPYGNAIAIGWGIMSDELTYPDILQTVNVNIMQNYICEKYWVDVLRLTDKQFCTNPSGNVGICRGDSGGPLVQGGPRDRTVLGIASFGKNPCSDIYSPPIYTKISKYIDWIHETIKVELPIEDELPIKDELK